MNLEYFIAKNIIKKDKHSKRFTRPVINISVAAIALGLIVMIVAVSIVSGFQREIRNKVIGFGSHIQITNYDSQNTYEVNPISKQQDFYPNLDTVDGIKHIQVFATKAGIIKTKEQIYGVVVKGIGSDYNWEFFQENLVEGMPFVVKDDEPDNQIVISKHIANKMKLKVLDKMFVYFIQSNGQLRPKDFVISGIYQTDLEGFDDLYVIADIAHIQKRNGWDSNQVGGFEILIDDFEDIDRLGAYVYDNIAYDLFASTIKTQNPDIFSWLDLQNYSEYLILGLMIIVAVINIISALLILILERTNMIGILKALGLSNWNVRKIFLYNAGHLIVKGLIIGNVIGIVLCGIQQRYGLITLPEESYYISVVPIDLDPIKILMLNGGTLIICLLMLIVPSMVISRISPIKAIRYD